MTTKLLDLSSKLDSTAVEIIGIISAVATANRFPFFIIGATARDLFFKSRRATIDLDLGIHIATWKLYDDLIDELLKTMYFKRSSKIHRILYMKEAYPVDIVPFGALSKATGKISWPDKKQMSILGFEEAYQNSYEVQIGVSAEKSIRVASPVGLVLMKLISWSESTDRAEKDAQDLELMFSDYYSLFNNSERVYDFPKILETVHFDLQRAGIMLLGQDTAAILTENETAKAVRSIIEHESNDGSSKLAIDMMNKNRLNENEFSLKSQMLNDFQKGLNLR